MAVWFRTTFSSDIYSDYALLQAELAEDAHEAAQAAALRTALRADAPPLAVRSGAAARELYLASGALRRAVAGSWVLRQPVL